MVYNLRSKQESIDLYHQNPHKCIYCAGPILVIDNQPLSAVKKKKFCTPSCYHKQKAIEHPARVKSINEYNKNPAICLQCGQPIRITEDKNSSSTKNKSFCDSVCYQQHRIARIYEKNLLNIGKKFNRLAVIEIKKFDNPKSYIQRKDRKPLLRLELVEDTN